MNLPTSPPTWLADARSADEAATGRRAAKAARKATPERDCLAQCECGCLATATVRGTHLLTFTLPAHWADGELIHDTCGRSFTFYDTRETA